MNAYEVPVGKLLIASLNMNFSSSEEFTFIIEKSESGIALFFESKSKLLKLKKW